MLLSKLVKHDFLFHLPRLLSLLAIMFFMAIAIASNVSALLSIFLMRFRMLPTIFFIFYIVQSHSKSLFGESRYLLFSIPASTVTILISRIVTVFIEMALFTVMYGLSGFIIENGSLGDLSLAILSERMGIDTLPPYMILLYAGMILIVLLLMNTMVLFIAVFLNTLYRKRFKPLVGIVLFLLFLAGIGWVAWQFDDLSYEIVDRFGEWLMTLLAVVFILSLIAFFFTSSVALIKKRLELS